MAKVTAPLLSFAARGSIGKSITFSSWKGIDVARKYTIPANPNTVAQQGQRNVFKWVHDAFKYMDTAITEAWAAYASGKPFTPMNAFTQKNVVPLKGKTDLNDMVFLPSVLGGPPASGITVTPGTDKLTVAAATPVLPAGWSTVHMIAVAMPQQTPSGELEPNVSYSAVDNSAPYSVDITGLTTGQAYAVGVGFKYTRADGKVAYGGSENSTGTPT